MKSRKDKVLLNLLLGTGIYLLESMRGRMGGTVDDLRSKAEDLRSRAQDTYETASDRVSRAADVIRGEDGSNVAGHRRRGASGPRHRRGNWPAAGSGEWRRNPKQHRRKGARHSRPSVVPRRRHRHLRHVISTFVGGPF